MLHYYDFMGQFFDCVTMVCYYTNEQTCADGEPVYWVV